MVLKEATINRREIEAKLSSVGDYVKMDYLSACLKKNLDFDTKKFVLIKLSEVYESRKMYLEAARMIRNAAEINTTFEGKMNDFVKSMSLFVKGGSFDESEVSFAKALACAEGMQKERIKATRKEAYRKQAEDYVSKDKRKHAMDAYQKYLSLELTSDEKKAAQSALLMLYEKLGKITEYNNLKRAIANPAPVKTQTPPQEKKTSTFSFREIGLED